MKKVDRLKIILIALRYQWDGYHDVIMEVPDLLQLKENVKQLNNMCRTYKHYHKQFTKLTGNAFRFQPKILKYSELKKEFIAEEKRRAEEI